MVTIKRAAKRTGAAKTRAVSRPVTPTPVKKAAKAPRPASGAAKPKPAAPPTAAKKAHKPGKDKLVRDSFTIPEGEYGVIAQLKQRALKMAHPAKKSEVLRAGVKLLAALADTALLAALKAVPSIKTGRPKADGSQGKADKPKGKPHTKH